MIDLRFLSDKPKNVRGGRFLRRTRICQFGQVKRVNKSAVYFPLYFDTVKSFWIIIELSQLDGKNGYYTRFYSKIEFDIDNDIE